MVSIVNKLFKSISSNSLKKYDNFVNQVNRFEDDISILENVDFKNKTKEFKEKLSKGSVIEEILPEAFAVVREASKRTVNMRHFDVQLIGGKVLHEGKIAEMKTGEGKTLVATLAAYANSLIGNSVHIITVNDYLAKRDSVWMGKVFNFLGLTVGCITSDLDHISRPIQYNCDIVYATNNEIGFDYLRDNLKNDYNSLCFKNDAFAIVDEVDSILIDEARTPLVISAESNTNTKLYPAINKIIKYLKNEDFELNEENKSILLTTQGMELTETLLKENGFIKQGTLQDIENISLNHNIVQALRANKLFKKDIDYIVKNKNVIIIDELTGRPMEGRRFGDGLHQAIEAKENLVIQKENQTIASITYQNFFRTYKKLSGMTGTALTEAKEFEGIYNLEVVDIPPNLQINRNDKNDQIYMTKKEKYEAVIDLVKSRYELNQPILIGTTSVENSEKISKLLFDAKISHNVLNAKNHQEEAEIILKAGIPGNVTISTNMAGRGTDIKLGNDNEKLKDQAIKAGGMLVIGTERHESRRIDNQLRGRSGRQILEKYSEPNPEALVESAKLNIKILEDNYFTNFKISVKSSDIFMSISAYNKLAKICDYPLHLGITEAGGRRTGSIKSSIGIGNLLLSGIGDTIRVSLSDDPEEEVKVGFEILKSLGLRNRGVKIISCPSCARQQFQVINTVKNLERRLEDISTPITVSIIGCVVNGPGEATMTDIGITGGGNNTHMIYLNGKKNNVVKNIDLEDYLENLIRKKSKEMELSS